MLLIQVRIYVILTSGAFPKCCDKTTMLIRVSGLLLSYKRQVKKEEKFSTLFQIIAWIIKQTFYRIQLQNLYTMDFA